MLSRFAKRVVSNGCPARSRIRRLRLKRAALTYASHGWHVIAGARLCGDRFRCGPSCATIACHPLHAMTAESMEVAPMIDAAEVAHRWRDDPHSVLLATGGAFDVVEVPAYIGALAGDKLRGPVAVTPQGQWMFLVRPGEPLHPQLAGQRDVVLHGLGSWIPAPPVRTPQGVIRWIVTPQEIDWQLPDADEVQTVLAGTLPWLGDHLGDQPVHTA